MLFQYTGHLLCIFPFVYLSIYIYHYVISYIIPILFTTIYLYLSVHIYIYISLSRPVSYGKLTDSMAGDRSPSASRWPGQELPDPHGLRPRWRCGSGSKMDQLERRLFWSNWTNILFFVFRRKWGFHQKWRGEQHCLNLGFTDTTKLPQIKEMEDFKCNIVKFKESIQTSLKTHKIPLCFPIFPEAFPRPWQKTHVPRAWPGSVTILFMGLW